SWRRFLRAAALLLRPKSEEGDAFVHGGGGDVFHPLARGVLALVFVSRGEHGDHGLRQPAGRISAAGADGAAPGGEHRVRGRNFLDRKTALGADSKERSGTDSS